MTGMTGPWKVFQSRFQLPGGRSAGNSFAACLATLLGCQLWQVPWLGTHRSDYAAEVTVWLGSQGLYLVDVQSDGYWLDADRGNPYTIAYGVADHGSGLVSHSVVMRGVSLYHDPHPQGHGLAVQHGIVLVVPMRLDVEARARPPPE